MWDVVKYNKFTVDVVSGPIMGPWGIVLLIIWMYQDMILENLSFSRLFDVEIEDTGGL